MRESGAKNGLVSTSSQLRTEFGSRPIAACSRAPRWRTSNAAIFSQRRRQRPSAPSTARKTRRRRADRATRTCASTCSRHAPGETCRSCRRSRARENLHCELAARSGCRWCVPRARPTEFRHGRFHGAALHGATFPVCDDRDRVADRIRRAASLAGSRRSRSRSPDHAIRRNW